MKDVNLLLTNGVNVNGSLELLGDIDTYNDILNDFLNGYADRMSKIKSYKETGEMPKYAIEVHALKSDSKYLGFTQLAELAYNHEMASKGSDINYVLSNYDSLITEAERIHGIAKQYMGEPEAPAAEVVPEPVVQTVPVEPVQAAPVQPTPVPVEQVQAAPVQPVPVPVEQVQTAPVQPVPVPVEPVVQTVPVQPVPMPVQPEPAPVEPTPVQVAPVAPTPAPAPVENSGLPALVVADDSEIIRNIISKMLSTKFRIVEAVNGNECATKIAENLNNITGLLLDLNMPEVDGFAVLEFMKTNDLFMKVPVVIITGDDSKETIMKAFDYPIVDVLNKPFNESDVTRVINAMNSRK